jgi:hypothetical protein
MSEFRFRIPLGWKLNSYHASSIFVVGLDGIPWPCKVRLDDESEASESGPILHVVRNQEESGKLYFIYPFRDRGEMIICTGTLPVREAPYDLLTELARGTLNRLRNQVSIWEEGGLVIDSQTHEKVALGIKRLGSAIMMTDKAQQDAVSAEAIELAMDGVFRLSVAFGDQISKFRREHKELSRFWMANRAGLEEQFSASAAKTEFDLIQVSTLKVSDSSSVVEESETDVVTADQLQDTGKRIVVGPWLDASLGGMPPEWVQVDDYLSRRDKIMSFCRRQLESLPSTTSLLHLISGLNGIGHRNLSYPQQLQIAVDMLQLADESLIEAPVMISFDFPWGERLARAVGGIHPLQIADSLLRQGLKISFLGLDINLDYFPNGSAVRDPLQWIDLIDVWAQLDLPLILCLRSPSGSEQVPADRAVDRLVNQQRSNLQEQQRLKFLNTVLPMLVARPSVHGIVWRQWQDGDDDRFPHGGLVDAAGNPKPIYQVVEQLRNVIGGPEPGTGTGAS